MAENAGKRRTEAVGEAGGAMGEAGMGRGAVEAVWRRSQRRGAKHGAQEVRLGEPDGQRWGQVHVQVGREHGMTLRSGKRCRMIDDVDVACKHGHGAFLMDGEQRDVCVEPWRDK